MTVEILQSYEDFPCQSSEHTISKGHCKSCPEHCQGCCDLDECECCGVMEYSHKTVRIPKRWFCVKCNIEVKALHFAFAHGYNSAGALKVGVAKLLE